MALTYTAMSNLEFICLKCMFLDCARKLENPERTIADPQRIYRRRPSLESNSQPSSSEVLRANNRATASPCCDN